MINCLILLASLISPPETYTPNIDVIKFQIELETGCKMKVTSGYRTPAHNKRVGGVPGSYHLKDRARDIVPVNRKCISLKKLAKIACKYGTVLKYNNHVHIDNRKKKICIKGKYKK